MVQQFTGQSWNKIYDPGSSPNWDVAWNSAVRYDYPVQTEIRRFDAYPADEVLYTPDMQG